MSHHYDEKPRLPAHEWLAVVFICGTFLLFAVVSILNDAPQYPQNSSKPHNLVKTIIEIEIQGAVGHPGIYQVEKGTPLRELIAQVEPNPNANLKSLKLDSKMTRRRKITIRENRRKKNNISSCIK